MNGASQIEIEVLALSAVIFVIPLLVAICLVRRSRIRRRRPPVSFLEVIRGKS
jgi:hypothetical protein